MKKLRWLWWWLTHRHDWRIALCKGTPITRVDRECRGCGRYEVHTRSLFVHVVRKGGPKC